MRAKAMPGEDPASLPNPEDIAPLIVKMLSEQFAENDTIVTYRDTTYFAS